jgi:hypothetical protein
MGFRATSVDLHRPCHPEHLARFYLAVVLVGPVLCQRAHHQSIGHVRTDLHSLLPRLCHGLCQQLHRLPKRRKDQPVNLLGHLSSLIESATIFVWLCAKCAQLLQDPATVAVRATDVADKKLSIIVQSVYHGGAAHNE